MTSAAPQPTPAVRLHELLRDAGLPVPSGLPDPPVTAVSADSRRVAPGTLFVGLPGGRVDGGSFWPAALQAGASAAVIGPAAAALAPPGPKDPVLVLADPLADAAGRLAAAFWGFPSAGLRLIGVTGTNGKTTTTHLIEHLAAAAGWPAALFGTLVNRWPGRTLTASHTTPFADQLQAELAQAVAAGVRLAAMEVSSHALDQQRVAGCRFSGAVFTNLTQDHLDYHPSMEDYFQAKGLLFSSPLLQGGAVVNVDDPWGARLAEQLRAANVPCWGSSLTSQEADLTITDLRMAADGVEGVMHTPEGSGA
ncbi:MAG: Mur ligase family protein, partial [Cyanobacteriota bacterium]